MWTSPPLRVMSTLLDFGVKVFKNCLLGGDDLSFSGKEVRRNEDHHQLAGENRHHRTTGSADGSSGRRGGTVKRWESSHVWTLPSKGDVHTLSRAGYKLINSMSHHCCFIFSTTGDSLLIDK